MGKIVIDTEDVCGMQRVVQQFANDGEVGGAPVAGLSLITIQHIGVLGTCTRSRDQFSWQLWILNKPIGDKLGSSSHERVGRVPEEVFVHRIGVMFP